MGLVIKSTGSSYLVYFPNGDTLDCHVKGNFRIKGIRSTNPVAVGDHVEVQTLADGTNWITAVCERKNYIIRRSTNLSKESHIIAANLDQVALLVTVNHPITSTTFIDRFLATCEAYRVPATLIFNKIDLLSPEEEQTLQDLRTLYESLGYATHAISALDSSDLSAVSAIFTDKITLLSGNSGVGKSTLLNAIFGKPLARTGAISNAHNKGTHTTTFSEMIPLPDGGYLIDTPGIKGFGTIEMEDTEISHYFPEIFKQSAECRFNNCTHRHEPGCAVLEAVKEGLISESRYKSYLNILEDKGESKYREEY